MPRTLRPRLIAAALGTVVAASGVAVVTAGGDAAGAAGARCVAWAELPAQLTLSSHTVLRPRLVGTAGCHAGGLDHGATATLTGPGRHAQEQRWERFGDHETVDLYRGLDKPGRYTISGGDVQTYDAGEVRVSSAWRTTSVVVKYGSRFSSVDAERTSTRATLKRGTADGSKRAAGTRVTLQRKTSHGWTAVASKRTSRSGAVSFAHGKGTYRLVAAATSAAWGTVATVR